MIISFIAFIIEIQVYAYVTLKLITDYTRTRLLVFSFMVNYKLFGLMMAIYVLLLNGLVLYSVYIPHVTMIMYEKNKEHFSVVQIKNFVDKYNFNKISNSVITIGDTVTNFTKLIIRTMVTPSPERITEHVKNKIPTPQVSLDEISDAQLEKLDTELNSILNLGKNIMTKVLSGEKDTQYDNVNTFMGKLGFSTKLTPSKKIK